MTAMCIPHAPVWPDQHRRADHLTMPPLLPVQIAADPLCDSLSGRRELIHDLVVAYTAPVAARLWRQARAERRIGFEKAAA